MTVVSKRVVTSMGKNGVLPRVTQARSFLSVLISGSPSSREAGTDRRQAPDWNAASWRADQDGKAGSSHCFGRFVNHADLTNLRSKPAYPPRLLIISYS